MVVLSHGREIGPEDLPRTIREGGSARFLPVPVPSLVQGAARTDGRELEFILRSLLELKLQVEELRRRMDDGHGSAGAGGAGGRPRAILRRGGGACRRGGGGRAPAPERAAGRKAPPA